VARGRGQRDWGAWGDPADLGTGWGRDALGTPAVLDAGGGQAGACPSPRHRRRVPAHRHCLNTARDARAKRGEGGGWDPCGVAQQLQQPHLLGRSGQTAGSCQKGTGQAGVVSRQQHCRCVQPHQYQSKREVQGMGGSWTLPSPRPITTMALPLPCLCRQGHRCRWSGSLGTSGGRRQPCQGGGAWFHRQGAGGCPIAPSPGAPRRAERGRAGSVRGDGSFWPLQRHAWQQQPGPESRREVLPQNWAMDWDGTGLRAGWQLVWPL